MKLSDEQAVALATIQVGLSAGLREMVLEAPAGSGKTRCAVEFAKKLGARVVTFTRRAGRELMARAPGLDAGTLYALAARQMSDAELSRVCTDDVLALVRRRWLHRNNIPKSLAGKAWAQANALGLRGTEAMLDRLPMESRVWIVDEAQDMTGAEIAAIRRCARQIVWIGDTWQQLYGWRGAAGMPKGLPTARLTVNFRSCPEIVARAAEISRRPEIADGGLDDDGRVAVLCRTNDQARQVAALVPGSCLVAKPDAEILADLYIEAVAELGVTWAQAYRRSSWTEEARRLGRLLPVEATAGGPAGFLRWLSLCDVQDFIWDHDYEGAAMHGASSAMYAKAAMGPDKRLGAIAAVHAAFEAAAAIASAVCGPSVLVMTIHAAKGLEFGRVIQVGKRGDGFQSYVSVTRARRRCSEVVDVETAAKMAASIDLDAPEAVALFSAS